jgi:Pyruvate/2-oxoacid:ferredoxin oxidoreductase delta subunit/coenzyme F420-reducing hydrogenase delta subunit
MRHLTVLRDVPVRETRNEPPVRGERAISLLEWPFLQLDRFVPEKWNPLAHTGAIANVCFLIASISGVLLLLWYSPSVHTAWTSLEAMGGIAQLTRSIHRYSSDGCMLFVLLHALRYTGARRFSGARWLAWVTGLILIGSLWLVGWLGYWLVWDQPAQSIAVGSARALDALPIFSDPMGRSFLLDKTVHSLLFFTIFFLHMLLPLAMGVALWLHITRLHRSKFLTHRAMTLAVCASLVAISLVLPARSGAPAQMLATPSHMRIDAWYLLPLAITDRLGGGLLWLLALVSGVALFVVPWALSRGRATPAVVDPAKCNACTKCVVDCPYNAVTMANDKAVVDPDKCVGCGICAGSCDSSGIALPLVSQVEARARLDRWIEQYPNESIAFVCSRSAGQSLKVDPDSGGSSALPGYRVMPVVCAGWIHPLTIERALRHGAPEVLIVSCAAEPTYREGPSHTRERIAGERQPALRHAKVDPKRVRVVDRLDDVRPKRTGAVLLAIALSALLAAASRIGYAGPTSEPELIVSFKHAGRSGEGCRKISEEEKQKLPPHMRRDEICDRGRAPVRLRVEIDGVVRHQSAHAPKGLRADGPSIAVEHIALTEGEHRVVVSLGESHDPSEWTRRDERTITVRRRAVVLFEPATGFTWEAR